MKESLEPRPLSSEALARLRSADGARDLAALPGPEKVRFYAQAGAAIGEGVELGPGSLIVAERLALADGVRLGPDTRLEGAEVSIGALSTFEGRSRFACRKLLLGPLFFAAAGAEVGWGGEWDPRAEFRTAKRGFMGEGAAINPARPVTFEDRVALGAGSRVYTHQFWQSRLEGFPQSFAPVTIGRNTQLGALCVLAPGTKVGADSFVLSNSLLSGHYPPDSMIGGVPARVIQTPCHRRPTDERRKAIAGELLAEAALLWSAFGGSVESKGGDYAVTRGKTSARVRLLEPLRFEVDSGASAPMIFDLDAGTVQGFTGGFAAQVLREVCRKSGVLFEPDLWRFDLNG